jgi:hypothetical protein
MRKAKGRALVEAEEAAAGHGGGCIGGFWDELNEVRDRLAGTGGASKACEAQARSWARIIGLKFFRCYAACVIVKELQRGESYVVSGPNWPDLTMESFQ